MKISDFLALTRKNTLIRLPENSPDRGVLPLLDSTVITHRTYYSNYKVILSGNTVENYISEYPFRQAFGVKHRAYRSEDRTLEYAKRNTHVSKNKIRRLVNTNFDFGTKFLTLTFKNTDDFDITSLSDCVHEYQKFIKRLRRKYGDFKYITISEFQDKYNRGAVHFHIITNLQYVPARYLKFLWGHGFIKINSIINPAKTGVYVSKYITKSTYDLRYRGKRRFYYSSSLTQPITIYGEKARLIINNLIKNNGQFLQYVNNYDSMYNGNVQFIEFNFVDGG